MGKSRRGGSVDGRTPRFSLDEGSLKKREERE